MLVPPIRNGPKLNYDKDALEPDIRSGHLKPTTIAGRHGVGIATVYGIKAEMKKAGRLGPIAPTAIALQPHTVLSPDTVEQIQDLREEGKTTTEIANMLALEYDAVAEVMTRSSKPIPKYGKQSEAFNDLGTSDDDVPEKLAPEEEEDDIDDDEGDAYDPLANRGRIAGGDILFFSPINKNIVETMASLCRVVNG